MIDKKYCLSSFMAYRYIWKDDVDFYEGFHHKNFEAVSPENRIPVTTADDIDREIQKQIDALYEKYDSIGILLSGGMDSANVASYLKPGSFAYTFSTELSDVYDPDKERAEKYCAQLGLIHKYIDISFDDYKRYAPIVMHAKGAPVHSIEPQIFKAAMTAKEDGVELLLVGESADLIFGGMDKLIGRDWTYDEFVERYTFLDPAKVLADPADVTDLYERYRVGENDIDYLTFMDEVFSIESSGSYYNAFGVAGMTYYDPYAKLVMAEELDLKRVRSGEPKYLVRELFAKKYPDIPVPDKIPMPRPVDIIFRDWEGPARPEFRDDIAMDQLTGNQKWQLWCAEEFLNMFDFGE